MAEKPQYAFSRVFQRRLASYALKDAPFLLTQGVVRPEYFEDPFVGAIVHRAISYLHEDGHHSLTLRILHDVLSQEVPQEEWSLYKRTLKILAKPVAVADQAYVLTAATDFSRIQNYRYVLRQAIDLVEKKNLKGLDRALEQALVFGKDSSGGIGSRYFSGTEKRLSHREAPPDILKSMIRGLDESLEGGGYGRGELHLWAALPSQGKSHALLHLAKVAVIQKKKVVLYTLEMSESRVATRLDASFAGVNIAELRTNRQLVKARVEQIGRTYGDSLIIKGFPSGLCKVSDLKSHLQLLRLQGFIAEVIIVDYVNIMGTPGGRGQRYRDLGQVYVDLRGLGQQLNCWVFSACQSNRGGYDAVLLTMKSLAESFEGSMHADTVVTLNRTDEEAQREYMRLYVAKDRNGVDRRLIPIHTNFSKGSFYRRE